MAKITKSKSSKVPSALQKRAKALHEQAQSRLAAKGFEALAHIREKRADIAGDLVDIGKALLVLQEDGVAAALGRDSFDEVCKVDLEMSPSTARRMISVSERFSRETVLTIGPDRAQALIEISDATPGKPPPTEFLDATLSLPSGAKLAVGSATAAQLHDAARELRHAGRPSRRGLTASTDERKRFADYASRLKTADLAGSTAKLVASRDEEGAWVEVRVRLRDLEAAVIALRRRPPR